MSWRYAICNETFGDWPHDQVCRFVAETGYQGLEIAPFTLAPRITDVPMERRRELRRQARDSGLEIVGLHWLLAKTEGLMVTSPDAAVRRRTAEYLIELTRACRDMGGSIMVFGSPLQRKISEGKSLAEATDYCIDTLTYVLPALAECEIDLCLEPLSTAETDFLTTCAETVRLMDRLNHPHVKLHLDVKAMSSEADSPATLIRRHAAVTGHFHANDANRRGPGFGDTQFKPIFAALREANYGGWVSVEVFDYTPDPETIARESLRHMKECTDVEA